MPDDEWMTIERVASLSDLTEEHLAQMRYRGIGPAYYRLTPRMIRYRRSEVIAWMESTRVATAAS